MPNSDLKRRPGRPIVAPRDGEKATLGVRVTAELKRELQAAAEATGASLSEEAANRLKRSFAEDHASEMRQQLDRIEGLLERLIGKPEEVP